MPITRQMEEMIFTQSTPVAARTPVEGERKLHTIEALAQEVKYHVAAYCRVSTDSEEQEGSLIVQREHFLATIKKNPDWEFVDIYYEQGISGTKKETRPELNRLLQDCKRGKVNLVLTKSISRFARNTTDCLDMVRTLVRMGVHLVFEKEQIDTRLVESEFLMTLLASLAEEESHSYSENNRWSIQKRFQNNTYRPATAPYGYDLVDGKLVINESEERIVRMIFDLYLSGIGAQRIAVRLREDGVQNKRTGQVWQGKEMTFKWTSKTILKILQNVDYIGDAILQQMYHDETFKLRRNQGEKQQYYITDRHPAIISRDTFAKVQRLIAQRREEHGSGTEIQRHLLSGKVYCGYCGSVMYRAYSHKGAANRYRWLCKTHHEEIEKCSMRAILEEKYSKIKRQKRKLENAPQSLAV